MRDIYSSFDCNSPVDFRSVFLDMSKALNRVWHDGLIHKIKCIGINVMLWKLIKSSFESSFQSVVLNGQTSSQEWALDGVPQDSVLGSLFFLIYMNDSSKNLSSNTKLFADDIYFLHCEKYQCFHRSNK